MADDNAVESASTGTILIHLLAKHGHAAFDELKSKGGTPLAKWPMEKLNAVIVEHSTKENVPRNGGAPVPKPGHTTNTAE